MSSAPSAPSDPAAPSASTSAPPIRFGPSAQPLHDLSEVKSFNNVWLEPSFQAQYPGGLYLCMFAPEGQWIYRDCKNDDEWIIYAAPTPAYLEELVDKVGDIEGKEPLKGCVQDTEGFEPSHHFEPVQDRQEILDGLDPQAGLEEAMRTLWRTCKGCVEEMGLRSRTQRT